MKYPISTDVIGTRGSTLGCRGVIKAIIPDDHYEVYFSGLGQYTVAASTLMTVDEFKAMRDDLAQAQARIAELETVVADMVAAFHITTESRDSIRLDARIFYEEFAPGRYAALRHLLDLSDRKDK